MSLIYFIFIACFGWWCAQIAERNGRSAYLAAAMGLLLGPIALIIYTALGNSKYPKENLELYCDNTIYKMTDYLELEIFEDKINKTNLKQADKGHLQELIEFHDTLIGKNENLPIKLDDIVQTTKATFLL